MDTRKGKLEFKGSTNTHVNAQVLGNVLVWRLPGASISKEADRCGGTQLTCSGITSHTSKHQEKLQG